jgi:hypothetical protein
MSSDNISHRPPPDPADRPGPWVPDAPSREERSAQNLTRSAGAALLISAVAAYLTMSAHRPDAHTCQVINDTQRSFGTQVACSPGIGIGWTTGCLIAASLGLIGILLPTVVNMVQYSNRRRG